MEKRISRLDSLRALAVMLVVFYHLDIAGFSFGYLGVDIFFMLSGFLMTHTMFLNREEKGQFEVGKFYIRRIKRIVPSLFITIFLTGIIALFLFSPEQLIDTAKQGFYSLLFISNFLFFDQAGYFAPENEVRALLHTWSLSVEEQFYLLFGLMLLIGKRINFTAIVIALSALGLFLLLAAYWSLLGLPKEFALFQSTENLDAAIFYLMPFRLFQFLSGALIAIAIFKIPAISKYWLTIIGNLAPIIGVFLLYNFPAAQTISSLLIVIVFSFAFISNPILDMLGQVEPIKFIAKISYQIYLTHWPLIVFWRYWTFEELNSIDKFILLILSIISGWALYKISIYMVSAKFSWCKSVVIFAGVFALSIAVQATSFTANGASWRIPEKRQFISPKELREMESAYCGETHLLGDVELGNKADQPLVTCSRKSNDNPTIYVLGDSHARQLLPGLSEAFPNYTIDVMYFTSCLAQSGILDYKNNYEGRNILANACVDRNQRALEFFKTAPPSTIIIHQYAGYEGDNSEEFYEASNYLLEKLTSFGHEVTWIGSVLRPDILVTDCLAVPNIYSDKYIAKRCKGKAKSIRSVYEKNEALNLHFPDYYINPNSFFCNENEPESCVALRNGIPLFRDKHHLTVPASIDLVDEIKGRIKFTAK